jgi:hypothetical protein
MTETKKGRYGNKKGFFFQTKLSEKIGMMSGYESAEVDEPSRYCDSIKTTSRDKVDNYIERSKDALRRDLSAKCPGGKGGFQMSSFTIERQLKFLKYKLGTIPENLVHFCYSYFGHVNRGVWLAHSLEIGVDVNKLSENELRRQRTFGTNIPKAIKEEVENFFNNTIEAKVAFHDMHLASGFTEQYADFQVYHPAKTFEDINFESNNFYVVDLNLLREMCKAWTMKIGKSTTNFGPLNWKVRGGGGKSCTPTKGSYHNAQCFSGINKMKKFAGETEAFFKGTLEAAIDFMYGKKK